MTCKSVSKEEIPPLTGGSQGRLIKKVPFEFPQDFHKEQPIAGGGGVGNDKKGKGIFVGQRIKTLGWSRVFQDGGK